ncbi:hypothetical protein [Polyangium jinanense]|uniref:Lipoprotein n=1 Tax=Polyangium jinanense TaxID=2829994 RepID=A0A9X3WZG0_9BACT|nr:hypothetical protein [Polyangium jinanense]MDC3953094.1 hypothetical protein [Polyangium jinanense]MDC3979785.1 hypothetical protein [Polyangium jinanense]
MHKPLPGARMDRRVALQNLVLAVAAAVVTSCDNIDNFEVDVGAKATIPAGTVLDELLGVLAFNEFQSINLTQELDNQGVTKDDVDSVRMISLSLVIDGPAGANFDFLESLAFYAETEGQPKVLVAELDPVPKGQTSLDLVVSGAELKPYVVAPSMKLTTTTKGKRPPEETMVTAAAVLDVDVTVPGC